jgi:hypothetical protein
MTCQAYQAPAKHETDCHPVGTLVRLGRARPVIAARRRSQAMTARLAVTAGTACLAMLPIEMRDTLPLLLRSAPLFGLRLLAGR